MSKVLAIILISSLLLCGCSADNRYVQAWNDGVAKAESQAAANAEFMEQYVNVYFEKVAKDSNFNFVLYRDVRTDVLYCSYISSSGYGRGAAMTVMYAADGTPLLYSEWLLLSEEVPGDD